MARFRNFVEATGVSGLSTQDFSSQPLAARMAQGRVIGERFIIDQLKKHGVVVVPSQGYHTDATLKIDGYLNGDRNEAVQIKLRRSTFGDRNDIAYEVCRNHRPDVMLSEQLKDVHQQGRDWKGEAVKHYFVLNREETEIYYTTNPALKAVIIQAIRQLNLSPLGGRLAKPFKASTGIELRPTKDPDPQSFTPNKVMAFVPVEAVAMQTYPVV